MTMTPEEEQTAWLQFLHQEELLKVLLKENPELYLFHHDFLLKKKDFGTLKKENI